MNYKSFNIKLIIRLILLLVNFIILSYSLFRQDFIILPLSLIIVAIFQIIELIHQLNTTNRTLSKFLQDVNYQDVSAGYGMQKLGGSFKELEDTYRQVLYKMKEISHEKESSLELLNSIVEQIDVGLIVVDEKQEVKLMNSIAQTLLNSPNYKQWDRFRERLPVFTDFVEQLNQNKSSILIQTLDNQNLSLSITKTQLIQLNKKLDIITIVSIGSHLGKKEVESYNKLISVLTHEIMNTISPIASLSKIVEEKLSYIEDEDINQSIKIIANRSEGLLDFVKNYRKISKIPEPKLSFVHVDTMLNNVKLLMSQNINNKDIIEVSCVPKSIEILMDKTLIEQSLINLVKNSIEAKKDNIDLKIQLMASQKNGQSKIEIIDNGKGIPTEIKQDVLVPFYTSKEEGTGIGLSIVNQIMIKHNGNLDFNSSENKTVFTLNFN